MSDKTYFVTDGERWAYHVGNGRYQRFEKIPKVQAMPYTLEDAQKWEDIGIENIRILTIEEWRESD